MRSVSRTGILHAMNVFMKVSGLLVSVLILTVPPAFAEQHQGPEPGNNIPTTNHAFAPGEKLTYNISWSSVITAGSSEMEVRQGDPVDGRPTYRLVCTTHSVGLVDLFFPVRESVESVIDAESLYSISFSLRESYGKRKRHRLQTYDHQYNTVHVEVNDDPPETLAVPKNVQDALSTLYYVRTRQDFTIGKAMVVDVQDGHKNWSVEIIPTGREKIKTPAGEFATIKVRTYPKYEGVFEHKGEIYIWFTDDSRKLPVRMQSIITIGSIVATLTDIQGGKE